ncbi:MAG: NAD(P)(+) transhydrogenase (Re/Si-specific) subunit beta [Planctomycetes bacterium]|nr:NAD(P)(+) transhydrogenase (Re/Si-specific) subunit beta [Planctomycetota bacterium]
MTPHLIDLGIILILIAGISQFRAPRQARVGNLLAAAALAGAVAAIFARHSVGSIGLILAAATAGAASGSLIAWRIGMIQIPAMVAVQNGMGGLASMLVSYVELTRQGGSSLTEIAEAAALLGLVTGAATFSGSLVAAGKLANQLRQTPVRLPCHNAVLAGLTVVTLLLVVQAAALDRAPTASMLGLAACSIAMGIVFSVRVGGADMPVLISFLNATTGLAAALCGVAVGSRLLVACGATVAASGFILTHVMCRAMNRGLASVFTGIQPPPPGPTPVPDTSRQIGVDVPVADEAPGSEDQALDPFTRALTALRSANQIIIVPGYGMALADAQEEVVQLADRLAALGKRVRFAIHPVAGRMPGHMHVLLAEADVDYGLIAELKDINADFAQTDLALIVGACDVVNPAALKTTGTPISGMPILRADEARNVVVCNLDDRPGYSGVDNPLYRCPHTTMLLGDAKATISRLLEGMG